MLDFTATAKQIEREEKGRPEDVLFFVNRALLVILIFKIHNGSYLLGTDINYA